MCWGHWRMVPTPLQDTIYARYRALRRDYAFLSDLARYPQPPARKCLISLSFSQQWSDRGNGSMQAPESPKSPEAKKKDSGHF